MLNLRDRNRGTAAKVKLPAGVYDSVVVSVEWSQKYGDEAYEIVYEITSQDGKVYRHTEIFMCDPDNQRTARFEDYLADNGICDLDEFVDKREKLTFGYQKKNGNEFFNIVKREFVA